MIGMSPSRAAAMLAAPTAVAAARRALRLQRLSSIIRMTSSSRSLCNLNCGRRTRRPAGHKLPDDVRGRGIALHGAIGPVLGGLARPRFAVPLLMIRQIERRLTFGVPRVQRYAER